MRTQSEIDISNLRKIISDRDRTLELQALETKKLKNKMQEKSTEQEHKVALLKSSISEAEIALHNKNCAQNNNVDYQTKYEELLAQVALERGALISIAEEKSVLSEQNNKLSKDHGFESLNSSLEKS